MAGAMGDHSLSNWPIFSLVEESFLRSLKLVLVFGSAGDEAIVVTHSDEVYALGSNASSCLGLGETQGSFHPRIVRELCNKGIALYIIHDGLEFRLFCARENSLEEIRFSYLHEEAIFVYIP